MSLPMPRVELGAPKICHFWNNALEWESSFTLGLNTAKNTDYIEKLAWNKSCAELNILEKIPLDAYLYLPQEWS